MGHQVRAKYGRYVADADDQDAVMRTTERDRRVREPLTEARRDDHERRTPRQAAALAEKYGLRRADGSAKPAYAALAQAIAAARR